MRGGGALSGRSVLVPSLFRSSSPASCCLVALHSFFISTAFRLSERTQGSAPVPFSPGDHPAFFCGVRCVFGALGGYFGPTPRALSQGPGPRPGRGRGKCPKQNKAASPADASCPVGWCAERREDDIITIHKNKERGAWPGRQKRGAPCPGEEKTKAEAKPRRRACRNRFSRFRRTLIVNWLRCPSGIVA